MPYLWLPDKSYIENHLGDAVKIIPSGTPTENEVLESTVESLENFTVRYLVEWLSMGWVINTSDVVDASLWDVAGLGTAAKFAYVDKGVQFARTQPTWWANLYNFEIHERVSRWFIMQDLFPMGAIVRRRLKRSQRIQLSMARRPVDFMNALPGLG